MKKLMISCLILGLGAIPMPSFANNTPEWSSINTWSDLVSIFQQDSVRSPLALQPNITITPTRQENGIMNTHPGISLDMQGSTILGNINYANLMPGYMMFNSGSDLTLKNGIINSNNNNNSNYMVITNNGSLSLTNVNVMGGVDQMKQFGGGTLSIEAAGSGHSNVVTLSGPNDIEGQKIQFTGTGTSTLNFDGGKIVSAVEVDITGTNNVFNVKSGTVALDGTNSGKQADTWNTGAILSLSGGTVTFDNFANSTTGNNASGAYNQTGGTLNLNSGSSLTLQSGSTMTTNGSGSGSSIVSIGSTSANDTSSLVIESGVTVGTAKSGDTLTINIGAPNYTGNSLNVEGGTLDGSATVFINSGNDLNISSGNATLNGVDTWNGNIKLSGTGNLTFSGAGTRGANSTYTQTDGILNITNYSALTLNNTISTSGSEKTATVNINGQSSLSLTGGSITTADAGGNTNVNISSGSLLLSNSALVTNGTSGQTNIVIGTGNSMGSSLGLSGLSSITGSGTTVTVGSATSTGNSISLSGSSTLDSSATVIVNKSNNINIFGGTATLNGSGTGIDTVEGGLALYSGALNIDGVSDATNGVTYYQSGGTLTLANASTLKTGKGSTLTGGSVLYTGTGSTLDVSTGASFASAVTLNLSSGNNLNVSGGTATLNGSGTGADSWAGDVNVSGTGVLNLNGITSNATYNQTGGTTTNASDSALTLLDSSNLGGGNLVNAGTVNLSNTNTETVATKITGSGSINKNAAGTSIFTADNSGFTGTYTQSAGTSNIQNKFFAGVNKLNGGNIEIDANGQLTLNSGDSWTGTNVLTAGGTITLNKFSHDTTSNGTYNQTSGTLNLNNASALTLSTGSSISGGTVSFASTGNSLNLATGGSLASNAAINLTTGNTLNITGGTATLNNLGQGIDTWAGTVNISSGQLNLHNVVANGILNQTGGTTELDVSSNLIFKDNCNLSAGTFTSDGDLKLENTGKKTISAQIINSHTGFGGVLKEGAGEVVFTADNSGFNGRYYNSAGKVTIQNKFFAGDNDFIYGTAQVESNGSLVFNSGDAWHETVLSNTGGTVSLDNFSHDVTVAPYLDQSGGFNQTSGVLNLNNGSTLINNGTISGGQIAFGSTGNTLGVTGSGSIGAAASIVINTDNSLNISGGNVTLNANDDWSGQGRVNLSSNGDLTLSGKVENGIYTQTGGKLHLNYGLFGPATVLTLETGSSITGGNVDFRGVLNELDISTGSTFGSNAAIKLSTANTLIISGGTATLNGTGTGTDSWSGPGLVSVNGGVLNLNGISSNGRLELSDGTINIASNSTLKLIEGSSIDGGAIANSGTINLNQSIINNLNSFSTELTGNGVINKNGAAQLTFKSNCANFEGTYNQNAGDVVINTSDAGTFFEKATKNLKNGSLELSTGTGIVLKSTDKWVNTNIINSGLFTLDGHLHESTTVGKYNQTSGDLVLANGSTLKLSTGSSITGGTVVFSGTGNTLNISTGANFDSTLALNISTANNFNISGGTAELNGSGTGEDNWDGVVNVSSGSLNLTDMKINGIFNQTGGTTTIDSNSILTLQNSSNLGGGHLINDGTLALANTGITTIATQISGTGSVTMGTAGESIFTADNSGFSGTYNQTIGKSTIQNYFFAGNNNFIGGTSEVKTAGTLTFNPGDTWTFTNITNSGGTVVLDGFNHDTTALLTSGTYNQSAGITKIMGGSALSLKDNSNLSGGLLINNGTLNLTNTVNKTVGTSLSGFGVINKDGAGTLLLTGQNLTYTGDLYVNEGTIDFNAASGHTDSYISGKTYLANGTTFNLGYDRSGLMSAQTNLTSGAVLNLDTNGHIVTSLSNNISGNGTLNKTGEGSYWVVAGANGTFDYKLNVKQGAMNVISQTADFNDRVTIGQGPGNPVATLRIDSSDVNFNNGLDLSNGYMSILKGGFNVSSGGLSVGSTVNTMNGVVATNNISGNLNVGTSGTAHYLIDISPSTQTSDKYIINGDITKTGSTGVINISDFKIVGPHTISQDVNLKVFEQTGSIDSDITFTATNKIISSALGQYGLSSLGAGNYQLGWIDFNPQAFRGQVATEAAFANQLTTNNVLFDHIGLVSQQLMSEDKPNVYANENPLFAPYQYSKKDGSLWYKGFGNIERLQLSQNINTQNNLWGSLIGADFPIVKLKNGWNVLPTAYIGYTGGYQTYSGVNMYQNGGQGGIMGTFYKGDFITSLLANVGGYGNDMNVSGAKDSTGNWFAGLASKSAYNIKLPKDFILQPNMLLSYNAFGGQNWNSSFGDAGLTTGMLNGLNLAPGLNLILSKKTWSVYATTQLMFNLMNGVDGTLDNISLPTVKMGSTYFQYGVGATKQVKDRFSMYGQIVFSNGVRTGVGFQGGLQWKL